jgi:hypothetical protein
MSAYTNHGKRTLAEKQWAKINNDRKRSSYIEKICLEISKNYCSTSDRRAELTFILTTAFPRQMSDKSFTDPTFTIGPQLFKL